jgi:excisionase family DNA binding protein
MSLDTKPLTIKDAANYLGVSSFFIRERFKDGSLVATRLGANRIVRVLQSDLDEFIASRRVVAGSRKK